MTTSQKYFVHESSFVDEGAKVGQGTKVWHFSHIMSGAVVGEQCNIGQNVFIGGSAILGRFVKVQNNVSIYDRVVLEDYVFCGPSMVFTNVSNPRSGVDRRHEFRDTFVRKGATIGANATILCGIEIGSFAFIGAGSVVTKDVPAHALVYGIPAKHKGWMCECGLGLEPLKQKLACTTCGRSYDLSPEGLVLRPTEGLSTVF